ncbi:MAG: thioredoxin [Candidatus Pacearchaeota archaeon]|nr:thioredoxin [Candidatus Pacearchaeota archaeon]
MTKNHEVPELSKKEFDKFTAKGLVLVDFFAEWCMPCLMMAPVIDELSEKFKGKIKFAKMNIDENSLLAQKYKIMSIPNFILFQNGKPIDRFVGAMAIEDFEEKLKKHL